MHDFIQYIPKVLSSKWAGIRWAPQCHDTGIFSQTWLNHQLEGRRVLMTHSGVPRTFSEGVFVSPLVFVLLLLSLRFPLFLLFFYRYCKSDGPTCFHVGIHCPRTCDSTWQWLDKGAHWSCLSAQLV